MAQTELKSRPHLQSMNALTKQNISAEEQMLNSHTPPNDVVGTPLCKANGWLYRPIIAFLLTADVPFVPKNILARGET